MLTLITLTFAAPAPPNVSRLEIGVGRRCAVLSDGRVVCWSHSTTPAIDTLRFLPDVTDAVDVALSQPLTVLRRGRGLWTFNTQGALSPLPGTEDLVSLSAVGSDGWCGHDATGQLLCKDGVSSGIRVVPGPHTPTPQVAPVCTQNLCCRLETKGSIACSPVGPYRDSVSPIALPGPYDTMSLGHDALCVTQGTQVGCWNAHHNRVQPLDKLLPVSPGDQVLSDVRCTLSPAPPKTLTCHTETGPWKRDNVTLLGTTSLGGCLIDDTGDLACWNAGFVLSSPWHFSEQPTSVPLAAFLKKNPY